MVAPQELWSAHLRRVGAFIRQQRTIAELSQRELARLTKLSDTYLSQLERGLHQPSLAVLRSIAEGLGLHPEKLIGFAAGFEGEPPAPDEGPATVESSHTLGSPLPTEAAILADSRLTPEQRQALLGVLRSFLDTDAGGSRGT